MAARGVDRQPTYGHAWIAAASGVILSMAAQTLSPTVMAAVGLGPLVVARNLPDLELRCLLIRLVAGSGSASGADNTRG